ncbi:hypothetical protein AK88_01324 [Plasmodium fragile]|uniref:Uncharacterized protein n=1 Tax=Plasmodium fragile TaxID=5857 RepID=A0A0D9QQF6_PLAFR|nr:uncharacterized protein AK88_01324 [Plasmodium fragile]KJP89032.1 hypothetical protein AK88_01324 [Plasmodium fragile]
MFYLYNKLTAASRRTHEEKKDNIVDAGVNATVPAAENGTKGRSNERDNKEEDEDLFWALEEQNEPSRQEGIMEKERQDSGVEKGRHDNKVENECDIFLANDKMSERCVPSEISKQGGDTWWDGNPTWGAMTPLEGEIGTHLEQPNEYLPNGSKTDQTIDNTQQGSPLCQEFDENSDEFFKIDQDNFSSFTFAVSCANEWKEEKEHVENSNDEVQIKHAENEQHKEDPLENGYPFDVSSDHVKISPSLHPKAELESGNFDQTVIEGYLPREEMKSFEKFVSHEKLTTYFNKGDECQEENEEGIKFEGKVSTHTQEKANKQEYIFKEESVLPTLLEGEQECPLGTIADIGVSCGKGSRAESPNTISCSRGGGEGEVGEEAQEGAPNDPPMFDPVMPDEEESELSFFQGVHFPEEWQNAAHQGERSRDCSDIYNGESNYWPVDINICPKSNEDKFNFCSYEFPVLSNTNGKEEEDRETYIDNKKLEMISGELETQNRDCPIENAAVVGSEREEVVPKVDGENGKEVRSNNLCDEKQTCEVRQSGVAQKWDEEKLMQINTFQTGNLEMDNAKKSFDAFFCRDDEQYEVASMSENHGGDTFFFENKQTMEVVVDVVDVVEGERARVATARDRIFFDREETYEAEEAAEEAKGETPHGVYSFETVDLKSINRNETVKNSTHRGLGELTGRNEVGGILYQTGEHIEGIAVQREEEDGGKGDNINMQEMNESKGDTHFSGKEMEDIKTVDLLGQTKKRCYPHQGDQDAGNDHELNEHSKCVEHDPDDDAKHMLGEDLIKDGAELNSILFPNISNEQFVQEKYNGTENKLEGLLSVPTNMMQQNFFFDENETEMLATPSRDINPIRANDIEGKNKSEENSQREYVETVKDAPKCAHLWNEFYEEEVAQKVNWHAEVIEQNGPDAKADVTNEEYFEAANVNDKMVKGKKKKKIKKSRILSEKSFEYHSGSLKYLKALKELPPLHFLKCKDLRPFLRLFNIVLKAVRIFRFNEDYLYVLAGDETGCIYVKLEVKHEKFCQEEETFMLANCCVSVQGGHAFLEINEYSDIFSLTYNPIGTVNKSINFSDSKFVTLSAHII